MKISDPSRSRYEWLLVLLLLLLMLLKGVLWSLALPLWQGPDEEDHYNVIQFIGELGRLPGADNTFLVDEVALSRLIADVGRLPYAPEQRQAFSNSNVGPRELEFDELPLETRSSFKLQAVGKLNKATPFYYALAAIPYRLFRGGDLIQRAQVQRLFSLLMSSGIVIVSYLIARNLFPTNGAMRLTIPTLVVFHPMITQVTAVVSVDGFYILCYSLLILLSLLIFRKGFSWRLSVAMGTIFSIGFLTKPTINGFAPLVGIVVLYDWWRSSGGRRAVMLNAILMGLIILAMCGWWMLRSLQISNELFYFNPVVEGHRIIQHPFFDYAPVKHMVDYYQSVWGGIFITWWAHFGWLDTALPTWVYTVLRLVTFAAIAGLIYWTLRNRKHLPTMTDWQQSRGTAPMVVWAFLAMSLLIPVVLLQGYDLTFWWQYGNGRGLQGRYWLGTVVPMLTFLTVGLLVWIPGRWKFMAHNVLRAALVVLNFASLLSFVLPRYYL